MLDPHQVAALCDQAESQTALIKWRVLNASLPRRQLAVSADDLQNVVRPLQTIVELLRSAELRNRPPSSPETIRG